MAEREASVCYAAGSGGLACNDRWAQMGYAVEPICPLCGSRDSLMHRVWFCAHPDVADARNQLVDADMISRARADCLDPFWTTGIFLHPAEDQRYTPPRASEGVELRDAAGNLLEDISEVHFDFPIVASHGSLTRT